MIIIFICSLLFSLSDDYCSFQGCITCVLDWFDDWASSSFGSPLWGWVSIRNQEHGLVVTHFMMMVKQWFVHVCSSLVWSHLIKSYSSSQSVCFVDKDAPHPNRKALLDTGAKSIAPLDLCIGTQLHCLWLIASSICRSPDWGLRMIFFSVVKRMY